MFTYAFVVTCDLSKLSHYPDCDVISGAETRFGDTLCTSLAGHLIFFSTRKIVFVQQISVPSDQLNRLSMTKSQEGRLTSTWSTRKEKVFDLALISIVTKPDLLPSG